MNTLDRARKLFAMSQDASSPHEAEIAARRVKAMIEEHGLSLEELEQPTNQHKFGESRSSNSYRAMPTWYGVLALGVGRYLDCKVSRTNTQIKFEGFEQDVTVASLMLDYLTQTMERTLKAYKKETNDASRGASSTFRRSFAGTMQRRLVPENPTAKGQALMVLKSQLVAERFGVQRTTTNGTYRVHSASARQAGKDAANGTSLNRQVKSSAQARLS